MKIKEFLTKFSAKKVVLIGKNQKQEQRESKKFLILKGFNGTNFISQKENWSSFYRIPYTEESTIPLEIIFNELMQCLKGFTPQSLQALLSGFTPEKIQEFIFVPRRKIEYKVQLFSGVYNDEILTHKHFKTAPYLRIEVSHNPLNRERLLYLLQQLHLLQAICSSYWKRNASIKNGKTLFDMNANLYLTPWTYCNVKNNLHSEQQCELRIDSGISFDKLSWENTYLIIKNEK